MRKYYQLLLIIVSVISVVTLLFYRHEYLKLRYVLQVLDFFGTVEDTSEDCVTLMKNLSDRVDKKNPFSEPRSAWTQFSAYQVFSSFWIENGEKSYTRTIAVGPHSSFIDVKCHLWFEVDDVIISKDGEFSYKIDTESLVVSSGSSVILKYTLLCRTKNKPLPVENPYGVVFISGNEHRMLPVRYKNTNSAWESVLCIEPDYSAMSKINLVELLSYYDVLNVSHVIIYDNSIQHSIIPFLEYVNERKRIFQSVTVVNWNFPLSNRTSTVEYLAYKDDCLSRSYGVANVVILGSWNRYVIPKRRQSLTDLLLPFSKSSVLEIKLPTLVCCTDLKDDPASDKAAPLILRKSSCKLNDQQPAIMFIIPQLFEDYSHTSQMVFDGCFVRIYKECGSRGLFNIKTNPLRLKRAKDFTSHELLRLWKKMLQTMKINDLDKMDISTI